MTAGDKRLCTKTKDPSRAMPTVAPTKIKHSLRSCKRAAVETLPPNSCTVSTLQLNLTSTCEPACLRRTTASRRHSPSCLLACTTSRRSTTTTRTQRCLVTCYNEHAYNDLIKNVCLIKPLQTWPAQKAGGLLCINRKTSPEPIAASIWQRISQMLEVFLLFLVKCKRTRNVNSE